MRIATQVLFGILLLLLALPPALAQTGGAPSQLVSLNGDWQFALAHTPDEAEGMAHFYEPSFGTQAFRPIPVP